MLQGREIEPSVGGGNVVVIAFCLQDYRREKIGLIWRKPYRQPRQVGVWPGEDCDTTNGIAIFLQL